jgi:predicted nucleotidyltransferase
MNPVFARVIMPGRRWGVNGSVTSRPKRGDNETGLNQPTDFPCFYLHHDIENAIIVGYESGRILEMEKNEIIETLRANRALLEQFHVRSLAVFGSIVRGETGPESDVDILVEFDPGAKVGLFAFARLQRCLQDLLGRQVDLAIPKALHKALKQRILEEAVRAI